jgi:hypothetical protein
MRRKHISMWIGLLFLTVALGAASRVRGQESTPNRDHQQPTTRQFTARDIGRSYGFTCTGSSAGQPFAQVGQVSCDGIKTCKATGIVNVNGDKVVSSLVGDYSVDPDGLGFITYDVRIGDAFVGKLPIQFVLLRDGREIRGLPLIPGNAVICDLREQ